MSCGYCVIEKYIGLSLQHFSTFLPNPRDISTYALNSLTADQ